MRFVNLLPKSSPFGHVNATSVHLHGNASPPQYDGSADDLILPGEYKDYRYPNKQHERTNWYHDHAIHHTSENTYMGLAGFYISHENPTPGLPKGKYDVPLMIQDKIFSQSGQLIFDDGSSRSGHDSLCSGT